MNNVALGMNSYALAGRVRPQAHPLVLRIRFQLPMALLLGVGLPLFVRGGFTPNIYVNEGTINSIAVCTLAVIAAYFGWRRLHQFPGVQLAASALWSVGLAFGAAIALLVLLRLDYNRTLLVAAPVMTALWLVVIAFVMTRAAGVRIGVVPGGAVGSLPRSRRVEWVPLVEPGRAPGVDAYVADLRFDHSPAWEEFIADRTLDGVPVYHSKQVLEHLTGQVSIEHLSENNFGSVLPNLNYVAAKRLIDLALVAVLLPLLVPVFAALWLAIRLVDGPEPLFRQKRKGMGGRCFTVYKFRTMRDVPEAGIDPLDAARTKDNDQRVTPLGNVLRKTRLDEIPQVINIVLGEMTWIGPRPEASVLGERYESAFPFYRYRYAVRPGITGWAQVNQGHVVDDADIRVKLRYDFYYVKNISPWLDLLIAIKTIRIVLWGVGAR